MMDLRTTAAACLVAMIVMAGPHTLRAQTPTSGWQPDLAAWGSVGVGSGSISGIAGVSRENISVGPVLLSVRQTDIGPFISAGPGVRDNGVLFGVRTGGHRLFGSGALGYSRATPFHQCDTCGYTTTGATESGLAYDFMLHANALVPGLAASFSGVIGSQRINYSAFTIGVELGWFGR